MSATATRTAHATVRTELTRYTVPSAGGWRILTGCGPLRAKRS